MPDSQNPKVSSKVIPINIRRKQHAPCYQTPSQRPVPPQEIDQQLDEEHHDYSDVLFRPVLHFVEE